MELHFTPELEKRLNDLASKTGRAPEALVEDAMAGYLEDLGRVREMLDSRYDDLKSGRVKPIDGEAFSESLRARENEILKRPPQSTRAGDLTSTPRPPGTSSKRPVRSFPSSIRRRRGRTSSRP